jgi:hypothetical protein
MILVYFIVLFFGLGWSGILASIFCDSDGTDNRWIVWLFGIIPTFVILLWFMSLA